MFFTVGVFRGRRGDLIKILWFDGDGLCLFLKRLERGRFVWPQAENGTVSLTRAQLSVLLEGIDWRAPRRTAEGSDLMATRGGDERKEDFKELEGLDPHLSPAGDPAKMDV